MSRFLDFKGVDHSFVAFKASNNSLKVPHAHLHIVSIFLFDSRAFSRLASGFLVPSRLDCTYLCILDTQLCISF